MAGQYLSSGEEPVCDEGQLELHRRGALNPYVCVTPAAKFRREPEIFISNVVAANKADAAVHDNVLPVIPEIQLPAVAPRAVAAECRHADAPASPFFDRGWLHFGAPYLVKEEADLHAVRRPGRQGFQKTQPEPIFSHDVELHENRAFRLGHFLENRFEGGLTVDEQIELISAQKRLARNSTKITDPGRLDLRAVHQKPPHFCAHFVDLLLVGNQGLLHHP
jgi:hypothetical protein